MEQEIEMKDIEKKETDTIRSYKNELDDRGPNQAVQLFYQENNIFVMDNHKCALKPWLDFIDRNGNTAICHIDAHDDCNIEYENTVTKLNKNLQLSLLEFCEIKMDEDEFSVIQWDNMLSLLIMMRFNTLLDIILFEYQRGDLKHLDKILKAGKTCKYTISQIMPNQLYRLKSIVSDYGNLIIDIDADYFFDEGGTLMYSVLFIKKIFEDIYDLQKNRNLLITFALSPECCKSLDNSLKIFQLFKEVFKLKMDIINDREFPRVVE